MKQHLLGNSLATLMAAAIVLAAASTSAAPAAVAPPVPVSVQMAPSAIEKDWGVEVVSIRLTAAGQYLDFRYKVVDENKAAPILNRNNVPQIIDQASGKIVNIGSLPKLGRLRQNTRKPKAGRTYFMLFKNPGFVKAGSKVAVIVGGFRIDNLIVEG